MRNGIPLTPPGPKQEPTADSTEEKKAAAGSAIAKSMAVLGLVTEAGRPVGLVEITERLGLAKPTAHRIIKQLVAEGLLRRELARDRYSIGPQLYALSLRTLRTGIDGGPAHAILENLVARIGETCNIGVLDHANVVYLDRVECDWPLRLQLQANSRLPAHCTAIGKVLMANLHPRPRQRLVSRVAPQKITPHTITSPDDLEQEFARIRDRDYATNNQEYHVGLIGVAVPIRDTAGEVVAGLALHAPLPRLSLHEATAHLPDLREAAAQIGAAIEDISGT